MHNCISSQSLYQVSVKSELRAAAKNTRDLYAMRMPPQLAAIVSEAQQNKQEK